MMGRLLQAYLLPHPPVLIPAVGGGREVEAAITLAGYGQVVAEIAAYRPGTIVVLTPHGPMQRDGIVLHKAAEVHGDMGQFGAAGIRLNQPSDTSLQEAFAACCRQDGLPLAQDDRGQPIDHGAFVPLWMIAQRWAGFQVVHMTIDFVANAPAQAFGQCLAQAIAEAPRDVVLIVSGDLSHRLLASGPYGYAQAGMDFELEMARILASGSLAELAQVSISQSNAAGQCGLGPLRMAAQTIGAEAVETAIYSHEWPFGVGYLVARLMKEDHQ